MSSRAVGVVEMQINNPDQQFDSNGFFLVFVSTMFTDPAIPGKKKFGQGCAHLDPAAPATWAAALKTAVKEVANYPEYGFTDLVDSAIYLPTFSNV